MFGRDKTLNRKVCVYMKSGAIVTICNVKEFEIVYEKSKILKFNWTHTKAPYLKFIDVTGIDAIVEIF